MVTAETLVNSEIQRPNLSTWRWPIGWLLQTNRACQELRTVFNTLEECRDSHRTLGPCAVLDPLCDARAITASVRDRSAIDLDVDTTHALITYEIAIARAQSSQADSETWMVEARRLLEETLRNAEYLSELHTSGSFLGDIILALEGIDSEYLGHYYALLGEVTAAENAYDIAIAHYSCIAGLADTHDADESIIEAYMRMRSNLVWASKGRNELRAELH